MTCNRRRAARQQRRGHATKRKVLGRVVGDLKCCELSCSLVRPTRKLDTARREKGQWVVRGSRQHESLMRALNSAAPLPNEDRGEMDVPDAGSRPRRC